MHFFKSLKSVPSKVIISRTDSIGDMILTLPLAKVLKDHFKNIKVYFLGKAYTQDIVQACRYSDGFIEMNDFLNNDINIDGEPYGAIIHVKPESKIANRAKQLNIKWRIGTTNRLYHWTTCNQLVRLSRKKSNLHEAQLNLKLLKPFGINKVFSFDEITDAYGLTCFQPLKKEYASLIDKHKYNIILHPKSRGSAREWGLNNFELLISLLDKTRYKIFISGSEGEKKEIEPFLNRVSVEVTDISGLMSLQQFISFISACDGLVACSTGPLHIAAATGIAAYGIYSPLHSIRSQRWGPVGKNAKVFELSKNCTDCYKHRMSCHCIREIEPFIIKNNLDKQIKN